MATRAKAGIAVAALVVMGLAAHFGFFFFRDNFSTHYALKVLSAEAFRSGSIPYWNFAAGGGQPLAGNPNALTFYPDNIFYLFLPAHIAFNVHFLIHLAAGWWFMRLLISARRCSENAALFGATVYLLSGAVISSTAFYNLVVAVAAIPLALWAVEVASARMLGVAFGLLILAAEPVTFAGAAVAVVITGAGRMRWRTPAIAVAIAAAIGAPQLVAWSEISGELERAVGFPVQAVLAMSLSPVRIAETFVWPLSGFLNDPARIAGPARLFSTVFLGIIALPALVRRSRYVAASAVLLLLAVGRFNPLLVWIASTFDWTRIGRYPEKLMLPLTATLVVLIAAYFDATRFRRTWAVITLVPLLWVAWRALPIDWFAPYRTVTVESKRIQDERRPVPPYIDARTEYRERAKKLDPLFGAVAGLRYALDASPDNMHSLLSAVVQRRFARAQPALQERYRRLLGCNVPGALPPAMVAARTVPARSLAEAVARIETPSFDEKASVVAPADLASFVSAAGRVTRYSESGQQIEVDVDATGPVLLLVNQSYFAAWVARSDGRELETLPLNVDRLGVLVPKGVQTVKLTFGRHHGAVAISWIASMLLFAIASGAELVEQRDRRASEVERASDENRSRI